MYVKSGINVCRVLRRSAETLQNGLFKVLGSCAQARSHLSAPLKLPPNSAKIFLLHPPSCHQSSLSRTMPKRKRPALDEIEIIISRATADLTQVLRVVKGFERQRQSKKSQVAKVTSDAAKVERLEKEALVLKVCILSFPCSLTPQLLIRCFVSVNRSSNYCKRPCHIIYSKGEGPRPVPQSPRSGQKW